MPRRRLSLAATRVMLAAVYTILLLGVACLGLLVTTQQPAVSLLVEPLSLFLFPGLIVSLITAGTHDLSPAVVIQVSAAFYFILFAILLLRRPVTHKRPL